MDRMKMRPLEGPKGLRQSRYRFKLPRVRTLSSGGKQKFLKSRKGK